VQELATTGIFASNAASSRQFDAIDFLLWLLISEECSAKITEVQGSKALNAQGEFMQWTAPAFEEVCLNCEINSYVSAKL
jgi:coenzyme PQQ precursor peptide PqqA